MNPRPRAAVVAGHLAGWCIIIGFVVLLTLIFNFLGTIICAALAGMMMGSARLPRRYCLVVSLIFPAVISAVLRLWRAELSDRQVLMLSALCFGVFWAIWGVMFALCSSPASSGKPATQAKRPVTQGTPDLSAPPNPSWRKEDGSDELSLAYLQGVWVPQPPVTGSSHPSKLLEIERETAVITCFDEKGQVRSKAQAVIRMTSCLLPEAGTSCTTPARPSEFSI